MDYRSKLAQQQQKQQQNGKKRKSFRYLTRLEIKYIIYTYWHFQQSKSVRF